jgi:SAM-dependent methyltransferase
VAVHDEGGVRHAASVTQYATDANLAARQRLWQVSRREPAFDLFSWVLGMVEGDRVLDVGCGNGAYLAQLGRGIGMDLSAGMLGAARERVGVPLVGADAQAIPFADASFDTVLAPHMLYHVPDRRLAARELRRVTRPGGACIAVTNGATTHQALVDLLEGAVGGGWRWMRSSSVTFSMENGAEQLGAGFSSVETVWAPEVTFHVTDADAVADYVASVADPHAATSGRVWSEVVETCRQGAAAIIERDGELLVHARMGAFVCR